MSTRRCVCDGTGFIPFVGDYKLKSGAVRKDVEQVRRCPGYVDYFQISALMRDYPEKTPPLLGHDICSAALTAHRAIFSKENQKRKDGKEL